MARFRLFRRLSSRSETNTSSPPSTTGDRRSSSPISTAGLPSSPAPVPIYSARPGSRQVKKRSSLPKLHIRAGSKSQTVVAEQQVQPIIPEPVAEVRESLYLDVDADLEGRSEDSTETTSRQSESDTRVDLQVDGVDKELEQVKLEEVERVVSNPVLLVEHPTPDAAEELNSHFPLRSASGEVTLAGESPNLITDEPSPRQSFVVDTSRPLPTTSKPQRPVETTQRLPSIVDSANARVLTTLIDAPLLKEIGLPTSDSLNFPSTASLDYVPSGLRGMTNMLNRKVWVKRPGASPTLVQIKEDDLVDDVRTTILQKYGNSLGRTFDAPDMVLYIISRVEQGQNRTQRMLGPEEEMCRTIDHYYPGGQTVDEALVIDTPQRRTPRPSPKVIHHGNYHAMDEYRPLENGTDYFPPMPAVIPPTVPQTTISNDSRTSHHHHPVLAGTAEHHRSISVLNTGQIPPLPSPGGTIRPRHHNRPKYGRQPTSSPTILSHPNAGAVAVNPPQPHMVHRASVRPRMDSSASDAHHLNGIPPAPPLPTPPAPEAAPTNQNHSQPPTPSGGPPHLHRNRPKKPRKPTPENQINTHLRRKKESSSNSSPHHAPFGVGLLDGSVPPINVLIVEDNIINLRILEGLMKRLKVRWQTAMNGQIAVDKWKTGGFHLVLMDIQMPVMNGLQATREIRRLESVNGIGVFSSISPDTEGPNGERLAANGESDESAKSKEDDKLEGMAEGLFKSPIIIVALTASSLQSDRHEALAAGCNDFLTKPVNFVWLERKVKEWGCMQALIDFDGWRKWKDFAEKQEAGKSEEEKLKEREKAQKDKIKMEKMAKLQEKQAAMRAEKERAKGKRVSINASEIGTGEGPQSATGLRSGTEVLGESGFELG